MNTKDTKLLVALCTRVLEIEPPSFLSERKVSERDAATDRIKMLKFDLERKLKRRSKQSDLSRS